MRFEHLRGTPPPDFTCGNKELDDWLHGPALENERRNLSRTYLLVNDMEELVGYYSLTMGGVPPKKLPSSLYEASPRYERGMVLIARLAVALEYQGQGNGRDLLIDAIDRAALAAEEIAAQFIAVDPIDENARNFYGHLGFRAIEGDVGGRMFVRLDEAIEALRN